MFPSNGQLKRRPLHFAGSFGRGNPVSVRLFGAEIRCWAEIRCQFVFSAEIRCHSVRQARERRKRLELGNLSLQPCGLTNPARQSLKSGPGRPGWSPTQAPHRSGLAHHAHPVPHLMNSRPARSVVVTWTWFRSQCTWHVSLQRLMRRHLLPSTGSLGLVPPLQRYSEVLRLPAAHFAALRFLRLAIPSLRPWFVPPAPDAEPWINRELVGGISSRLARWKRQGLPSSRRNPCDHSPYSSDPGVTRQAEWTMS